MNEEASSAPANQPITERDLDRAFDALEVAVTSAERGFVHAPEFYASVDEFHELARRNPVGVRAKLDLVIMGRDPQAGLDSLLETGALAAVFPEVFAMVGFSDGEWRHKDVWKHTKQVVWQSVPKLEVRWAALFHDIGKVKTRSISPDGKVHFFGHAEVGTRMFQKMERRMPLFTHEPALEKTVRFLILHHLRAAQYEPHWTDSAVRRFARELGEHLDELLCLSRADITTKRPEKKRHGLQQISELAERIRQLEEEDAKQPPLPSGVGDAIMAHFGLRPSRLIGDIKRALEAAIEAGEVPPHEPSEFYVEFVAERRERFGIA